MVDEGRGGRAEREVGGDSALIGSQVARSRPNSATRALQTPSQKRMQVAVALRYLHKGFFFSSLAFDVSM